MFILFISRDETFSEIGNVTYVKLYSGGLTLKMFLFMAKQDVCRVTGMNIPWCKDTDNFLRNCDYFGV